MVVAFSCQDALSGIASNACPAPQTLSGEGSAVSSSAKTVKDAAGNTSVPSNVVTSQIDRTAPTISAAATSSPNAHGWYNSNVTVAFSCQDSLSGIPQGACPASQTLQAEGASISSSAQSVNDAAGNISAPSSIVTVQLDKTAPTISAAASSAPNANGWYKSDVTVAFSCADDLSGVAAAQPTKPSAVRAPASAPARRA